MILQSLPPMPMNSPSGFQSSSPLRRGLFATDASMYQFMPLSVVAPVDRDAILKVMADARAANLPIIARGGGTSLTGQSIGPAVVLDTSRHMNRIIELNLGEGWVRVEPGVVCAELNAFLVPHGVHFAPDPATLDRACIGGMIANNAAGMRSVRYGTTIDHVLELDLVLATGEVIHFGKLNPVQVAEKCAQGDREGALYRSVCTVVENLAEEIRARYPKVIRRSGGYALDALVDVPSFNLAKLICGSEGTLGVILEAKLQLTPLPKHSALCLAHFATLDAALRAAVPVVEGGCSAAELIDGVVLSQAREHPLTREVCALLTGEPAAIMVIEVQDDDAVVVERRIRDLAEAIESYAYAASVMTEAVAIRRVWQLRSSALGLMTTLRGAKKPVPYIEDAAVPTEYLADYVAEVLAVCRRLEQPVSLFGHASVGLIHIRPLHDLHEEQDIARMKQIQEIVFPLVMKYKGAWSGEHGDGIVRGGFNRRFFGDAIYEGFREIKRLFDPDGRMNPGKILDTPPVDSNLRFGPNYRPQAIRAAFHFREFGGMLQAVEQCTGVASCRKTLSGVMCPSYMATRDEMHSTRARANALRLALSGQLGADALGSNELLAVMDLCLACKGCKGECPNSVDMARLKSEVLYQHRKGRSLRSKILSQQARLAGLAAGPQAVFINRLLRMVPVRRLLHHTLGLDAGRPLPAFATQRLSHWFGRRGRADNRTGQAGRVVLFNDTYMEHYLPQVGRAAIEVLEAAGYHVDLATLGDSQRSAISQGDLDRAKQQGTRLFERLDQRGGGAPILVCEPSCASALADDLPDLLDDEALTRRVAGRILMLDHFLERELAEGRCRLDLKPAAAGVPRQFVVHGHCHQKTLDGGSWTHRLLARIPNAVIEDSEAGCCGMAGAFGYEEEHAGLSRQIAEQRLLPRLAKVPADAWVVSNGFSCRHQIADLSERNPVHVAEVLQTYLVIGQ